MNDHETFVLQRFDGLSHAEVAERIVISRKVVEQHIKNAMLACRRCKSQLDDRHIESAPTDQATALAEYEYGLLNPAPQFIIV